VVSNTNTISGRAMAVIVGTVCVIAPWFSQIGLGSKVMIFFLGLALLFLGTRE